ncbi:DUF1631 domain-containing protein [Comamonadaceae bacterium BS-T2-15]|uniref:DUF1631 domain-containing protein n=2 Tax=Scleromatobacter humisilvae TaxID=2897159 RepID=A0A9X1YHI0_9BURK|nr:DUF1631 domain-containing protein [Scleromatobacter humisilvae]
MFAEQLAEAGARLLAAVLEAARVALDKPAERSVAQQRRDTLQSLMTHGEEWIERQNEMLRDAAAGDIPNTTTGSLVASMTGQTQKLMLVDDETVQKEIFISRLSQAIVDVAVWELNDLKTRVAALESLDELSDHDLFRPQQLAKVIVRSFIDSDFGPGAWADVENTMKLEISALATEAYHEANRFLIEKGVLPDVNLRTLIRRSVDRAPVVASRQMPMEDFRNTSSGGGITTGGGGTQFAPTSYGGPGAYGGQGAGYGGSQGGHGGGQGGYGGGQGGGYGGQGGQGGGQGGGQAGYGGHGGGGQGGYGGQGGGQGGYGGPGGHGGQGSGYVGPGGGQGGGGGGGGSAPGQGNGGGYGAPGQAGGNGGGAGGAVGYSGGNGQGGNGGAAGGGQGAPGGGGTADFMRNATLQPMGGAAGAAPGGAGGPGAPNVGVSVTGNVKAPAGGGGGPFVSPQQVQVDATLRRFGRTMERHVQGFMNTQRFSMPSAEITGAIAQAQQVFVQQVEARRNEGSVLAPTEMIEVLRQQKQEIKSTANTQEERATIEVVALLFASILTEDRIPSAVRVWFARLQMPTLRVAMAEPDFFSSAQHPARRLIDRMGASVMGFDAAPQSAGPELEAEVARVVQVVEAFPETGRKVFQTVLVEFERFLEKFFRDQNEVTKKGVSLASQVEQRETLAIQYTIELRKLLDGVPVQDGVREFLFQVWADILATTAMRHGLQSDETRVVREAALELVWIASAKTTREERADVIRRLGPLLAALRQGMLAGGLPPERQETSLRSLNVALTAAFAARTSTIDPDQFGRLKQRLEALDEILPDADFEIDDSFALDLSGHESDELEIVAEGGSTPSAGALAAADEMMVGAWYMLDYRDRQEAVQLAWQGMRKQLSLFVSSSGRCVLFQRRRLAAFLQAQLLVAAQDESLTIAATRSAIEKINADPDRLK